MKTMSPPALVISLLACAFLNACSKGPPRAELEAALQNHLGNAPVEVIASEILSSEEVTTKDGKGYITRLQSSLRMVDDSFTSGETYEFTSLVTPLRRKGDALVGYFVVTSTPFKDSYRNVVRTEDLPQIGGTLQQVTRASGTKVVLNSGSEDGARFVARVREQAKLVKIERADGGWKDEVSLKRGSDVAYVSFPTTREWSPWFLIFNGHAGINGNVYNNLIASDAKYHCSHSPKFQLKARSAFSVHTLGGNDGSPSISKLMGENGAKNALELRVRVRDDDSAGSCRICEHSFASGDDGRLACVNWISASGAELIKYREMASGSVDALRQVNDAKYTSWEAMQEFNEIVQGLGSTDSKLAEIDRMISDGFDLNKVAYNGDTPFQALISYGLVDLVEPLLARGLSIDPSVRDCADQYWFTQYGGRPEGLRVLPKLVKAGFSEECLKTSPIATNRGFICGVSVPPDASDLQVNSVVMAVDQFASFGFDVGATCMGKTIVERIQERLDAQRLAPIADAINRHVRQ
jgi:hypothetical protein